MMETEYSASWKKRTPEIRSIITVNEMVPFFVDECKKRFIHIEKPFAAYLIDLLVRDAFDRLNLLALEEPQQKFKQLEEFLDICLDKYTNPLDPTICSMKMCFYLRNCREFYLDRFKEKYESTVKEKLRGLKLSILQYPETSNHLQIEEMFVKMQIFVITNYQLGCPGNRLLLKQTRQSLNSVLGKGDLRNYILKKKHNRSEYLQRLGATVCGIVIFNCHKSQAAENDDGVMRNIFSDLTMSLRNTKESLGQAIKRASICLRNGTDCLQTAVSINISEQNIKFLTSIAKIRDINKYVALFHLYKRHLEQIKSEFEKTQTLVDIAQKKFNCVVDKIKETIKFRSAIESELVFPHFVYLSEVWSYLVLHLHHLVTINKTIEQLEEIVSDNIEHYYNSIVEENLAACKEHKNASQYPFGELNATNMIKETIPNFTVIPFAEEFCALTLVLTNGILVPSKYQTKICANNSETLFGFANANFANYSQRNLSNFATSFFQVIFGSADLAMLFGVGSEIMKESFDMLNIVEARNTSTCTQTLLEDSSSTISEQSNISWNVWDYHRDTIRLANMRRNQTHSNQTTISFGQKNSQCQVSKINEELSEK